jgi:hypothetical protein
MIFKIYNLQRHNFTKQPAIQQTGEDGLDLKVSRAAEKHYLDLRLQKDFESSLRKTQCFQISRTKEHSKQK